MYVFNVFVVVSQSPPQVHYIKLNITNRAGQAIVVHSGDDMPSAGFPITANVIAMITKTVPGPIATSFTVYGSDGQKLQFNQQSSIVVNPTPTKQNIIAAVVGKPGECIDKR